MLKGIKMTCLDNGFFAISDDDARRLARSGGDKLPGPGRELLVEHAGAFWWLARTVDYRGERVWSIRGSGGWRREGGRCVLGTL